MEEREITRQKNLANAKERLIQKEEDYIKKAADIDVKLVVKKCQSALIEQGRLVGLHQRTLEEHQIYVKEAKNKADKAVGDVRELRSLVTEINKVTVESLEEIIGDIAFCRKEIESGYFYRFKKFFRNLF